MAPSGLPTHPYGLGERPRRQKTMPSLRPKTNRLTQLVMTAVQRHRVSPDETKLYVGDAEDNSTNPRLHS